MGQKICLSFTRYPSYPSILYLLADSIGRRQDRQGRRGKGNCEGPVQEYFCAGDDDLTQSTHVSNIFCSCKVLPGRECDKAALHEGHVFSSLSLNKQRAQIMCRSAHCIPQPCTAFPSIKGGGRAAESCTTRSLRMTRWVPCEISTYAGQSRSALLPACLMHVACCITSKKKSLYHAWPSP